MLTIAGPKTAEHTCRRCGRKLTSPATIADPSGLGATCKRRVRQEAARILAARLFSPEQIAKALELIMDGGIVPTRHRNVRQAVASNGTARYFTTVRACTCRGHHKHGNCYHRAAVIILTSPARTYTLAA